MQTLGPANPFVSAAQFSNTLAKVIELAGFRNSSQFINRLPSERRNQSLSLRGRKWSARTTVRGTNRLQM